MLDLLGLCERFGKLPSEIAVEPDLPWMIAVEREWQRASEVGSDMQPLPLDMSAGEGG